MKKVFNLCPEVKIKKVKPREISLEQFTTELMKDHEFLREFCKPDGAEIIMLRHIEGLTQSQLAQRVGTHQSSISRFESDTGKATLDFIGRMAYALGYKAEIKFTKLNKPKSVKEIIKDNGMK